MDPELKRILDELRGELGKNVQALARVDQLETAAKAKDADLKLIRTELDTIKAAHVEQKKAFDEMQRQSRVQGIQRDGLTDSRAAVAMFGMLCRSAMANHLRQEVPSIFAPEKELIRAYLERATLQAGAVTGSYTVPTVTESELLDALEQISELLSLVDMRTGLPAASTIYMPTLTGRPTLQPARASVDTAMTQSDPAFGQLALSPNEGYIYFPVDNRLMQMSALSLGTLLTSLLRDSLIQGMTDWLINADGTATYNSITGILKEATAAYIYSLPAGKTAFSDLTKADMQKIKAKCLKRGRAKGVWLASLEVQGIMEDMDRLGKVPVITYDQAGNARALQNPIEIDEGMPDLADSAANTAILGFGDPATWLVGLVGGIQVAVSTEYLFGKNQTAFRGVLNLDIKRKPVATFITAKTAAV